MDQGPSFYRENIIRITLVNEKGHLVLESLVAPLATITESRAFIHGIEIYEYENALDFKALKALI